MKQHTLGQGLRTSALGLGCMGMSDFYGPGDEAESIRGLRNIGTKTGAKRSRGFRAL